MSPEDKLLWDERDRRYTERFQAQQTAIDKSDAVQAAYKASQNEWRGTLTDRDANFARKDTVDELKSRMDRSEGRSGGYGSLGLTANNILLAILAIATVVIALKHW